MLTNELAYNLYGHENEVGIVQRILKVLQTWIYSMTGKGLCVNQKNAQTFMYIWHLLFPIFD